MGFWDEHISIGGLVGPRFMAAPLDGITDSPMRQLIREFSPDELLFGEMRHVSCVVNERTGHCLKYDNVEHPIAFQFSANTEKNIVGAVEKVLEAGFESINLNLGCPAKNVVRSGSGSALMADLTQLTLVLKEFMRAIDGRVPFTVKIRSGFKEKNAVEVAQLAEGLGSAAIMIHPRTQPQGFTGLPDHDIVRQVKDAVKVPVIMSGNINSFKRAQKVYDQTGVDGFMIGRALWGCPWKMREITDAAKGETFTLTLPEIINLARRHLQLSLDHYGPRGFHPFKKHLPVYIKGVDNASDIRNELVNSKTAEYMFEVLDGILPTVAPHPFDTIPLREITQGTR